MATTRRAMVPARMVYQPPIEGTSQRIHTGQAFDAKKKYGGAHGGTLDPAFPNFLYRWIDTVQINPASEPPRIVWNSGAQPIIRWGFRRIVRTFMAAGPRMYGRWFYAGVQINNFVARGRVTGVPQRLGTSYSYPRFQTGPRVIPLGPK
jgi:hypothetical protein